MCERVKIVWQVLALWMGGNNKRELFAPPRVLERAPLRKLSSVDRWNAQVECLACTELTPVAALTGRLFARDIR